MTLVDISPRPFLKWAGGKRQLISQYQRYFPSKIDRYFEPFLGGGAIFFYLLPFRAVLTDVNFHLIDCYCCVRDEVEILIDLLYVHQQNHQTDKEYYYKVRTSFNSDSGSALKKAADLIYLNRTCFNGLYRENSKGKFNVPVGRHKNIQICNPDLLRSVSKALEKTTIAAKPFELGLEDAGKGSFVYLDPPYYRTTPTSFTSYNRHAFGEQDQIRLKKVFVELAIRGVRVALSNSDCLFTRELYQDFNIHTIAASRAINSKASDRGKVSEILVTSY